MYTGIHGVAAVCAALLGRAKSGKGQHIDLALYDCMVSMHDYAVQCYTLSGGKGRFRCRRGMISPTSTVYGVFTARDGYLVDRAQVDDAWQRLATLLDRDLGHATARATRVSHSPRIAMRIGSRSCARRQRWVARAAVAQGASTHSTRIGVPVAQVQRIDEVLADPQILATGDGRRAGPPGARPHPPPNLPFRFSDCDTSPRVAAPLMGQHNRGIATSSVIRRPRSMQ